ncbi:MAG: ATP-binding protein, partial [Lachnospiraceae bacterium]|nr:ATP-binding protein [Lachnospiraceae bacterium]
MLGGSVYIAFIRLIFNLAGTILIFSLLSESRFSRKKTVVCYGCYGMLLAVLACVWYVADWESYARMVALVIYMCFAVFAVFMSRDSIYLAVYKLALTFYLMAVFVVGGLEISILFFER